MWFAKIRAFILREYIPSRFRLQTAAIFAGELRVTGSGQKKRREPAPADRVGDLPACSGATASAVRPCLFGKERQIVRPIFLFHAEGIDHVGPIVFGVGQNKRRVTHFISTVGAHR